MRFENEVLLLVEANLESGPASDHDRGPPARLCAVVEVGIRRGEAARLSLS